MGIPIIPLLRVIVRKAFTYIIGILKESRSIAVGIILGIVITLGYQSSINSNILLYAIAIIVIVIILISIAYVFLKGSVKSKIDEFKKEELDSVLMNILNFITNPEKRESTGDKIKKQSKGLLEILVNIYIANKSVTSLIFLFGGIVTLSTLMTAYLQIQRIDNQNQLLNTQNALMESSRRAGLIFELNSILNKADQEITEQTTYFNSESIEDSKNYKYPLALTINQNVLDELKYTIPDSLLNPLQNIRGYYTNKSEDFKGVINSWTDSGLSSEQMSTLIDLSNSEIYSISESLKGRIIALSKSLRPYRYLSNDSKLTDPTSPERAQLLTALVSSSISLTEITPYADFSYAELENSNLQDISFRSISMNNAKLKGSNLNYSNFSDKNPLARLLDLSSIGPFPTSAPTQSAQPSILDYADLSSCNLILTNFSYCHMSNTNLNKVDAGGANFSYAILVESSFQNARLQFADFTEASLLNGDLSNTLLPEAKAFERADLSGVNLTNAFVESVDWLDELKTVELDSGFDFSIWRVDTTRVTWKQNNLYEGYLIKKME